MAAAQYKTYMDMGGVELAGLANAAAAVELNEQVEKIYTAYMEEMRVPLSFPEWEEKQEEEEVRVTYGLVDTGANVNTVTKELADAYSLATGSPIRYTRGGGITQLSDGTQSRPLGTIVMRVRLEYHDVVVEVEGHFLITKGGLGGQRPADIIFSDAVCAKSGLLTSKFKHQQQLLDLCALRCHHKITVSRKPRDASSREAVIGYEKHVLAATTVAAAVREAEEEEIEELAEFEQDLVQVLKGEINETAVVFAKPIDMSDDARHGGGKKSFSSA